MTDDDWNPDPVPVTNEEQPPLADWWVWGVRKVAAVAADLLLAARALAIIFIFVKAVFWVFTREPRELHELGVGVAAFFLLWGIGLLLGHFSAERELPDPEGWLRRCGIPGVMLVAGRAAETSGWRRTVPAGGQGVGESSAENGG